MVVILDDFGLWNHGTAGLSRNQIVQIIFFSFGKILTAFLFGLFGLFYGKDRKLGFIKASWVGLILIVMAQWYATLQ